MKLKLFMTTLLLQGCAEKIDCSLDSDSDGLNDCEEQELGTNPDSSDSDGDGFSDADEVDCVSNPADANEQCYACGWEHNDPAFGCHRKRLRRRCCESPTSRSV